MSNTRTYIIFNVSELNDIDFDQVCETSINTVAKNADQSKAYVKYEGDMPSSIQSLTTKEGPYTRTELQNLLTGSDWYINVGV